MNKNKKIVITIIVVIFIVITGIGIYSLIGKSIIDREDFDSKVNDNNSVENEDNEKDKEPFDYKELSNIDFKSNC